MYTQCPECRTAFRVTAKVLQQAAGKVRCGGCEHVFSALDYLSEELPATAAEPQQTGGDPHAETSRLLETLDELAGPGDVRIEDTGVEWRVLAEAEADDGDAPPVEENRQEEIRYDDNTPLPDDIDDEEPDAYVPPPVPQRRESDFAAADKAHFEEVQGDLALSEPEDWTELLDEVSDADAIPLEVEEELADIHNQLTARDAARDTGVDDLESQFDTQAEALGLDIERPDDAASADVPRLDESTGVDDEADDDAIEIGASDEAPATGSDKALEEADDPADEEDDAGDASPDGDEDIAAAEADDAIAADVEDDEHSENIELEPTGEFERQIDVAARALSGEDDDETGDSDQAGDDDPEQADELLLFDDDEVDEQFAAARDDEEDDGDIEDDDFASAAASVGGDIDESGFSFTIVDDDTESLDDEDDDVDELDSFGGDLEDEDEDVDDDEDADDEGQLSTAEQEAIAASLGVDDPSSLFDENSDNVETIIMEGEFVRSAVEAEQIAAESAARAELDDPVRLADTYALTRDKLRGGRRRGDPPGYGVIGGVVVLVLVLAGQFVHSTRDSLATYGFFDSTIAPVYEALGQPVTPEWNIKGWQFESTSGSIDDADAALRIVSRISNGTDSPLPYPLVHVSLTDRFEEVMGSRVLEPGEYLAGNANVERLVQPGESFTAVVGIADPAPEATGFKLNVCYRVASGTVRCAIEDFKN